MNPGEMLAHYRILERLGAGGMGVVYKAGDTHLNRTVAIKVLPAEAMRDTERRQRFVQEAQAASAIEHPNIVTIHDISEVEGRHFIVMQYVAGQTLRDLLALGPLPLADTLRYAMQIADALAAAHNRGIVHRDLKPENVMVTTEGLVKILDFGLAKLTAPEPAPENAATLTEAPAAAFTEEGRVLGTAAYMSPEQAQGQKVDHRSDIFSFGSLLYEMTTGRPPFRADNSLQVMAAIVRDEPRPVGSVPPGLGSLIQRAMRKDPELRLQSMAEARAMLLDLRQEAPRPAPPGRRWWPAALAAGLVMVAVGWFLGSREEVAPPPRIVPFTSFAGVELDPAFSPDGNQVAFVWTGEKGDSPDIYVKLIDAARPLRLTTDPRPERRPVWSPDGRRVAFLRRGSGGSDIVIIPALGGEERKAGTAATDALSLSWSPDGRFLAVVDRPSPRENYSIYSLSVDTGEKRRLTAPGAGETDQAAAYSPDGQMLAFQRARNFPDLYLVDLTKDGAPEGEPRRLTRDERQIQGMAWAHDSKSLVFASNRGGNQALWRARVAGGEPEPLNVAGDESFLPDVSRDGRRLIYARALEDMNIWLAAPGRPPGRLIASTRTDNGPQFSPDGKRIAFASNRSGSDEIWICDADGSNATQATTFGGAAVGSPRWSADGRSLVFDVSQAGQRDLYVVRVEGGVPRRLTTDASDEVRPSWSRDGRWIYFASNRTGAWQIWKLPADAGAAVQVTKGGGREAFESDDGKYLYFVRLGAQGVWRVPVEGDEETRVTERGSLSQWGLSELGIGFLDTQVPAIEFFDLAAGRWRRVLELPKDMRAVAWGPPAFAVSRDGRSFLWVQVDRVEGDLVLVENFR